MIVSTVIVDRTAHRYLVRLEPDDHGTSQRHFSSRLGAELHAAELADRHGVDITNRLDDGRCGHA